MSTRICDAVHVCSSEFGTYAPAGLECVRPGEVALPGGGLRHWLAAARACDAESVGATVTQVVPAGLTEALMATLDRVLVVARVATIPIRKQRRALAMLSSSTKPLTFNVDGPALALVAAFASASSIALSIALVLCSIARVVSRYCHCASLSHGATGMAEAIAASIEPASRSSELSAGVLERLFGPTDARSGCADGLSAPSDAVTAASERACGAMQCVVCCGCGLARDANGQPISVPFNSRHCGDLRIALDSRLRGNDGGRRIE